MNKQIAMKILEDKKILNEFSENSYFIKELNRNPLFYKEFLKQLKIIYKQRPTDKINNAVDTVEMLSTIIDSIK